MDLPDYFALGKRKAIGYGTFVKEIEVKKWEKDLLFSRIN
jgi:hypothetical protein